MSPTTYRPVHPRRHQTLTSLFFLLLIATILVIAGFVAFTALDAALAPAAGAQGLDPVSVVVDDTGNAGILGPVIIVGLAVAFVKKIVDFPAYIKGKDYDAVTKVSLAWLAGIAVAFLLQATDFAKDFQLAGVVLSDTNPATVIFFGLSIASVASVGTDWLAARDNTRTSAVPPLVDNPPDGPVD